MKKILSYLIPAVILIGIFGGIALKLRENKAISEARVYHQPPADTPALDRDAVEPLPAAATDDRQFTGVFEANRETKISAEVQGKINQIMVDAGSVVSKGQTLVQLDNSLLQLQLQSVDVQIEGLTADVNRYSVLVKADAIQGVQLEKAQLGLKSAQVQRATIQEQIRKTTIKSPFNGIVFARLSGEGSFAAPGVPLLHILDVGQLKFTINVPENDLRYFKLGQSHEVIADAFPDKPLSGKVSLIASKANAGNSFTVQLTLKNLPNYALRVGMFGKITLPNQN